MTDRDAYVLPLCDAPVSSDQRIAACRRGQHGPIVTGEPVDLGACVNVDRVCGSCGLVVGVTSWTTAAWVERRAQETA